MAKETIGVGSAADDGTGDPLRTAFIKAQANFDELYAALGGDTLSAAGIASAIGVGMEDSPTFTGLTLSGRTSGRVALIGTSGVITDDAELTYNSATDALSAGSFIPTSTTKPTQGFYLGAASSPSYSANGTTEHFRFNAFRTMDNSSEGLQINAGLFIGGNTTLIGRAANNSLYFNGGNSGAGSVTTRTEINKAVASIADNTATAVFTVTIPNGAHSASIRVRLTGSMGAGGAIGANESTQDAEYMVNVARTAGVNAVATIGAVVGQAAAAAVAGAGTVAVSGDLGAVSGAVGATNTFTIRVTIARSGGSSANHTCLAFAELLNANASGVTIA